VGTEHVRWLAEPELTRPVMICAFTGWNDAGDAASSALRTMIESWGAAALAEIDPDTFTDFATVRPQVRLDEERHRSIVWPTVGVWSASLPGTDVILVLGPEPALKWRSFCEQVVAIAQRFEAAMGLTVGALLADVPHTRPTQIIGSATDEALIERYGGRAVFFGRFVSVLRETIAWVAGLAGMSWPRFLFWNALGGICWATGVGLVAYYSGQAAADAIRKYGLLAAAGVLVIVVGVFLFTHWGKKKLEERL
jgi:hypothetical protein